MPSDQTETAPRFSIISAVYNVARYLDDYIAAIEAQTLGWDQFEVVAVDDGSTDESLAILERWAAGRPGLIRVVSKPNGGQSSARNLGLDHARGEWVTFPDPDDVLEPTYLSEVAAFLDGHPETPMVATARVMLDDRTGRVSDTHPVRAHFRGGNRLRDLDAWPHHFHGSAPAAFFRHETIRDLGLRFDPAVRPNFEDGDFCVRYLLALERPLIAFVGTARYRYRKRSDMSSTLQTSLENPGRYTDAVRNGYLRIMRLAAERYGGRAPEWLQTYILYELSWYFTSQDAHASTTSATGAVAAEFHELMAEICALLDPAVIDTFSLRNVRPTWRQIMAHSYSEDAWHQPYGTLDRLDERQGLVRLVYCYTGAPPDEVFYSNGVRVAPAAAKTRYISYHEKTLLYERIVWLPSRGVLWATLSGVPLDLVFKAPAVPARAVTPKRMRAEFRSPGTAVQPRRKRPKFSVAFITWLATRPPVARLYRDAWVLMDRIHDADDSAEILFRYLRKRRRKINAWFVIQGDTADYRRLRQDGYRRIVRHGSLPWKLLMLNCEHLVSSHADVPVMRPPAILELGRPKYRFTFLQHGVIKDDLSGWLNPKPIDLFVTSTQQEYDSIASDGNAYTFTSREVRLTGLPRFDQLRRTGQRFGEEARDLVLITPTWRQWLLPPLVSGSQRRTVREDFYSSEFIEQWLGVLKSPELAEICSEQGLTVGFLPHPNLQDAVPALGLPAHVEPLSYEGGDVQEYFARAAIVITDYSSIAFNAAYIDRPVVYFQFDASRVLGGGHVGKRGYFDYERDGFGPVARTVADAVQATGTILRSGRAPAPMYAERIAATFPLRDGRCCRRVADAIIASTRRQRPNVIT